MTENQIVGEQRLILNSRRRASAKYLEEAPLYFAGGKEDIDPKRGLAINGPADRSTDGPETIRLGIVSDATGIQDVSTWATWINDNPVRSIDEVGFMSQVFPGFIKAFNCRIAVSRDFNEQITSSEIGNILTIANPNLRIRRTSELYASKVENVCRRVSVPDVIVCHTPEEVEKKCAAGMSYRVKREGALTGEEKQKAEVIRENVRTHIILQELDEDTLNLLEMAVNQDFRANLKAICLRFDTPIQILSQSTLTAMNEGITLQPLKSKRRQDAARIAWNLAVAIYYKSNRFPWRVGNLLSGTCYIGVSFYIDKTSGDRETFASLAQVFTDTGEGMVVRGESFRSGTEGRGFLRLTEEGASSLLARAIEVYSKHHNGQPPNRVVIHKSSRYSDNEIRGFRQALGNIPKFDFVTIGSGRDVFVYRNGDYPIVRGTTIQLSTESFFLFSNGYIPYLRQYDGPRVPRPLEISERHGDTPPEELAREILALTRLNWNTTDYCCFEPITLEFSRRVGEILGKVPPGEKTQEQYRYYM